MLPMQTRRKADVVVSALMILFGLLIIYRASQMPWSNTRTGAAAQWFLSPGLFPTVLGALLILFSLRVFVTALREGGGRDLTPLLVRWLRGLPSNRGAHRIAFMILWIGAYIFFGVGEFNYELVSAIFLFVFISVFWLPGAGAQLPKRLIITAAVSMIVPIVVAYIFSNYLYVPAP